MAKHLPSPLHYKRNVLHFDNISLAKIADKFKTPFYLYSEQTLINNFNFFRNQAVDAGIKDHLICFAVKANPNLAVLKKLAKEGSGADIVSGGELIRSLEAGISPQKIVFSGVGKTEKEILLALKSHPEGIYSFNVESLEELESINKIAKKRKQIARVAFRLNPKVHAKTHKHISTGFKTHKFGLLKDDILKATKSKKYWSNCKLVGLSVHIGSQLTCLKATIKAIKELGSTAIEIGMPLEFLDVGGGLGVDYGPNEKKTLASPKEYMSSVQNAIESSYLSKKPKDFQNPKIVFEPGRIISARAGAFITRVIRTKVSENCHFAIVDGGMNDFVRPSLYDAHHEIFPMKESKSKKRPVDIVGPICETADCFATKRMLSPIKSDDILAIADTGAYGFSMASTYNMRELPNEIIVTKNGKAKKV